MNEEDIHNDNEEQSSEENGQETPKEGGFDSSERVVGLSGMYRDWFMDYASYVILERAVPAIEDGLKPVQRRILHSMKELDDGRYNKVANIIGNTMKYHPHGDASIGDAMVQIGQKDLLIDCQGNWGNTLTGDGAAAPRYIEARLTKFANHVVFNPKTTKWLASYDGRNKEPQKLPVKFPLLLQQGAEGIAVGLACKILPHNFHELIDASIDYLRGRKFTLYPDFPNGGKADFTNYNDGLRGGRVRVRANIVKLDSKTLRIDEIPFGTTTDTLIESIVKATEKNKIKVKKIEDNTAAEAEILVHLPPGVSPDKMIDALYAFTSCELSISPNSCVIRDNKPEFLGVTEMLKRSTDHTVDLLQQELEIKIDELESQWHWASLEKIFIENRIYRDIEEEETWEGVIAAIDKGLKPFIKHLKRPVIEDDIVRLTEIRIKRISKFDSFKADENIVKIEEQLAELRHHLANLIDFAVNYFKDLKEKFGAGRERKTEIRVFDSIEATKVIVANRKLYVDVEEGFIGWSLKKEDFICECSELDDVIIFFDTGKLLITKIADKKFVGKGIIYAHVFKKGDKRTIYHMIYQDGKSGPSYMKRFNVTGVTRDTEYDLTQGTKGSTVHYFSANPNGRKEVVNVKLRPRPHLKRASFLVDFSELLIKGRASKGNTVTKEIISKVEQKEVGGSTLEARKVWWDDIVQRLNDEGRGQYLGQFKGEDKILTIHKGGYYKLSGFELATKFDEDMISIEKWHPDRPIACVYFNAVKDLYYVKRFLVENARNKVEFIPEEEGTQMIVATTQFNPRIKIEYNKRLRETKHLPDKEEVLNNLIDVKGLKAQGNQLTKLKIKEISLLPPKEDEAWPDTVTEEFVMDELPSPIDEMEADEAEAQDETIAIETETTHPIEEEVDTTTVEDEVVVEPKSPKPEKKTKVKKIENQSNVESENKKVEPVQSDEKPIEIEWDIIPPKKEDEKSHTTQASTPKKSNPIKKPGSDDQMTLF
jgi:topoisomerase-4 subunit A